MTVAERSRYTPDVSEAEDILSGALELPRHERARLARLLLASLDEADEPGSDEAWATEILARVAEVDRDEVQLEDWAQIQARVKARLARTKP